MAGPRNDRHQPLTLSYNGVIEDAQDINDFGQITGQALDAVSGTLVTFRALPIERVGR